MKLYGELAEWWPIFSSPSDYKDEAAFFRKLITESSKTAPRILLELGSGGGNNASHLKARFSMTLVDISPHMLKVSRTLNPECEHLEGDIRTIRLDRTFDAVFVHDAICHMTAEKDLKAVLKTAATHCKPGGVALFAPDFVRESFEPYTDHGGNDTANGSVRYVQWTSDPDPRDTHYLVDFGILLRNAKGDVRAVHDRHNYGLFPRRRWLELMREVGLRPKVVRDDYMREVFVGTRTRR